MQKRPFRLLPALSMVCLLACMAVPALAKPSIFSKSDDAKADDEPQSFLSNYDKLIKGKDADWVYFPAGSLKTYKSVTIKEFVSNGVADHKVDTRRAADYGKDYAEKWVKKEGFTLAENGELTLEGNVFNAWEPNGGARFWGGYMASPGCGLEVVAKDSSGKVVGEIRHKARGSTVKDCVENGLEEIVKALAAGK